MEPLIPHTPPRDEDRASKLPALQLLQRLG